MRMPPSIVELASGQHGVVSHVQAREAGLNSAALRRRIDAGLLEPVGGHALRFAGHPASWRTLLRVGLLDLGPTAVVAGRAAATLLGFDGFPEGHPSFLTARSARRRRTVGDVHSVA